MVSGKRRAFIAALTFLGVLLAAELLVRIPAVSTQLPEPGLYYIGVMQERIDPVAQARDDGMQIDLLFIGNSVASTNIDPAVVDAALAEQGFEATSFTVGAPGLTFDPLRVQMERLWLDLAQPRVVVLVVRYFDFIVTDLARESEAFTSGRIESRWVDESVRAKVELALIERVEVLQHAGAVSAMMVPGEGDEGSRYRVDGRGHQIRIGTLRENLAEHSLEEVPGGGTVAKGGYRLDVEASSYEEGLRQLRAVQELAESHGATFVILNMPEHPEKFLAAPDGVDRYASYIEALEEFAQVTGVVLVDPSQGDLGAWSDDDLYFDFHHLNAEGARAMSRAIAAHLVESDVLAD